MKNQNISKLRFISNIIKSLQMNPDSFMKNLAKGETYEIVIYEWASNLLEEGETVEKTLHIILERSRLVALQCDKERFNFNKVSIAKNRQKVMDMLQAKSIYMSLSKDKKFSLQNKINAFVDGDLYNSQDIVNIIIGIIQNTLSKDKLKESSKNQSSKIQNSNDYDYPLVPKKETDKMLKTYPCINNIIQRSTTVFG